MEAKTISQPAVLTGVGLHSGKQVHLRAMPAPEGGGIRFVRTDLPGAPSVAAQQIDPAGPPFRTTLKNGAAEVHTVEHLFSALAALSITDCAMELDGAEIPGMDGSALEFLNALRNAGVVPVPGREVRPIAVMRPVAITDNTARVEAFPRAGGMKITYHLDYPGHALAQGDYEIELNERSFTREISVPARTFVLKKDAEAMRAAGLGLGANCQNTVVIEGEQAIDTVLRFPNEPVRHKILDLIGDLYVLGRPVHAHIVASCSGHRANRMLAQELAKMG